MDDSGDCILSQALDMMESNNINDQLLSQALDNAMVKDKGKNLFNFHETKV